MKKLLPLIVLLTFCFTACSSEDDIPTFACLEQLYDYLTNSKANTVNKPIPVKVEVDIDIYWLSILDVLDRANRFVSLDLSGSTGMEMFDPDISNTGEKMIMSLVLPNTTEIIGHEFSWGFVFFRYFTALKKVEGANVVSIGNFAFASRTNLIEVSFPRATSIGMFAFNNCTNLTRLNFPMVTHIGENAFSNCINLTRLNFPVVTYIRAGAFSNCVNLTVLSFPRVIDIGEYAFDGCSSLSVVSLPQVLFIGGYAFHNCINLTQVGFPRVTHIGDSAFADCISLISVSFPASIGVQGSAFRGCTNLTNFILTGTGFLSVMENGRVLVRNNPNGIELVAYPSAFGSIVMNTITSIDRYAFAGCTNITSVSFPLVTSIPNYIFSNHTNLISVSFPVVTHIGHDAFAGCTNLNRVTLGAVTQAEFSFYWNTFPGNLREVYFAPGGGAGTYTRDLQSATPDNWVKE